MDIQFSRAKSSSNLRKHGLSLAEPSRLDWESMIAWIGNSLAYGEERWVGIAPLAGGILHTVVFKEIDQDFVRVISLRPSTRREIRTYAAQKDRK